LGNITYMKLPIIWFVRHKRGFMFGRKPKVYLKGIDAPINLEILNVLTNRYERIKEVIINLDLLKFVTTKYKRRKEVMINLDVKGYVTTVYK